MTIETTVKILSDKWWAYYFDEYSFTLFLVLMLALHSLEPLKSPMAQSLRQWLLVCFPTILKRWDNKKERRIKTDRRATDTEKKNEERIQDKS